ncbi:MULTISPECIES: hypothetical protein [Staphylococcus]|uniref:hypothetical protein n=1 Tax=Staphylococcus TaxID=1279 RepID=UPI00208F8209|nr:MULTISPECIES: hypothetical protein [Staphylococcus]MCO4332817.1 hypothetical protein [Staphylococcus hyicus]MCO4334669.1 hypothetical protein [Staphylococcus hyicus]MCO4334908.1 hypothetical protein [Staphylococcus hyicus]MCO4358229.1 hypothetical protein [Staphylococcus agnetis]MCO4363072.1 hypothetical protein [Staphylococcus agnetis]
MQQTEVWNIFFDDNKYQDLLNKVDRFLKESSTMFLKGYRLDAIDEQQKPKLQELENEFKAYAQTRLDDIAKRIDEIEKESTTDKVENPQEELIRRQNLQARYDFYSNGEIMNRINTVDVQDIDIFELSLLQKIISERFNDTEEQQVAHAFEVLKQNVLHPYENNSEYEKLAYDYSVIEQVGMKNSGVVVTRKDGDYMPTIKSLNDRYNEEMNRVRK